MRRARRSRGPRGAPAPARESPAELERRAEEAERRGATRRRCGCASGRPAAARRARADRVPPPAADHEVCHGAALDAFDRLAAGFDEVVYGERPRERGGRRRGAPRLGGGAAVSARPAPAGRGGAARRALRRRGVSPPRSRLGVARARDRPARAAAARATARPTPRRPPAWPPTPSCSLARGLRVSRRRPVGEGRPTPRAARSWCSTRPRARGGRGDRTLGPRRRPARGRRRARRRLARGPPARRCRAARTAGPRSAACSPRCRRRPACAPCERRGGELRPPRGALPRSAQARHRGAAALGPAAARRAARRRLALAEPRARERGQRGVRARARRAAAA